MCRSQGRAWRTTVLGLLILPLLVFGVAGETLGAPGDVTVQPGR